MTSQSVAAAKESLEAPRTLLLRLNDETRDEYENLQQELGLLNRQITLDRYRRLIERLYGFYKPWERAAEPVLLANLPGFAETRAKAPRLHADLTYLGSDPDSLPMCKALPDCANLADLLGALYVVESSTLDGQVASRHLEQSLGVFPRHGGAFVASYGLEVGAMWRSFCSLLTARVSPDGEKRVMESARKTLVAMRRWLCPRPGTL